MTWFNTNFVLLFRWTNWFLVDFDLSNFSQLMHANLLRQHSYQKRVYTIHYNRKLIFKNKLFKTRTNLLWFRSLEFFFVRILGCFCIWLGIIICKCQTHLLSISSGKWTTDGATRFQTSDPCRWFLFIIYKRNCIQIERITMMYVSTRNTETKTNGN